MEAVRTAPDGGKIHELPDKAFDFLIELWARSHNVEIVSVQYFKEGDDGYRGNTGTDGRWDDRAEIGGFQNVSKKKR